MDSSNDFASNISGQWQTVVNIKKQKKLDSSDVKQNTKSSNAQFVTVPTGKVDAKSIFSALDEASEERRVRILSTKQEKYLVDSDEDDGEDFDDDSDDQESGMKDQLDNEALQKVKKNKRVKKPKVTVASAANAIDATELAAFLAQISESYMNLPDIQLMRSADYFAKAFSGVTGSSFSFEKLLKDYPPAKSAEMPIGFVPDAIVGQTGDWLAKHSPEDLATFCLTLLRGIAEDAKSLTKQSKSVNGAAIVPKAKVGLLVILAILLRRRPESVLLLIETLKGAEFSKPEKLPTLSWAAAQVAEVDLVSAMWIWVRVFLPLAVATKGNPFARDVSLTFFESVICKNLRKARSVLINGATKKGERVVPPSALNSLLRFAFPVQSARTKSTERFLAIYPFVKEIALATSSNSKSTKPIAVQLLSISFQAAAEEPPELLEEACSIFVWSLSQNEECYKQWEKYHSENIFSSARILSYMVREWKTVKGKVISNVSFRKALKAIGMKNRELLKYPSGDSNTEKTVKKADVLCRTLLSKTSYFPSCFGATATVVVAGAVAYGLFELSPGRNPWGWDGYIILSNTHPLF